MYMHYKTADCMFVLLLYQEFVLENIYMHECSPVPLPWLAKRF